MNEVQVKITERLESMGFAYSKESSVFIMLIPQIIITSMVLFTAIISLVIDGQPSTGTFPMLLFLIVYWAIKWRRHH